jgi:ribosomal-protein-alanine acetyltransferase
MPPPARLRPARAADLPALLALEQAFPGDRMSARQFRHHLASPRALWRVADAGGKLVGYALVLLRRGSDRARLYSIAVDPAARGQGLGRRLLAAAEEDAGRAGCTAMTLEVREDNATANALYQAAGYRRLAALPAYYEDGAPGWRYIKRTTPNEPGSFAESCK